MAKKKNVVKFTGARKAWTFELANGHTYSLPLVKSLTVSEVKALRSADEGALLTFIDAHAPGLTDEITYGELSEVITLWNQANKEDMGESSASSTS